MSYNISSVLKQLRKTSGQSANDVIDRLKNYEIEISAKTLYGYESGLSMPNANVFVALCQIYDCDNPMVLFGDNAWTQEELAALKKYRDLDDHGKDMVDTVLTKEYDRSISLQKESAGVTQLHPEDNPHLMPVAAHERTDIEVTDEMRKHDDDLMDDDSIWNK